MQRCEKNEATLGYKMPKTCSLTNFGQVALSGKNVLRYHILFIWNNFHCKVKVVAKSTPVSN